MAKAAMWGLKAVSVVLGLLLVAPETMQLHVSHPLHGVVQRINDNKGPMLGLILSSERDEQTLQQSGYFEPDSTYPELNYLGRKFYIGTFSGRPAIVTLAEDPMANVAVTAQIMYMLFRIEGIIHYGGAGGIGENVDFGDVVVPSSTAFVGTWTWKAASGSEEGNLEALPSLKIGEYNVPEAGENKLGSIQLQESTLYTFDGSKKTFWMKIDPTWLRIASTIKGMKMQKCINEKCTERRFKVAHGERAASSDIYVKNEAFASFLHNELGVTTVDTTTAPVVSTAIANGVRHIVFRGVSNKPGQNGNAAVEAAENCLEAVRAFVEKLGPMPSTYAVRSS